MGNIGGYEMDEWRRRISDDLEKMVDRAVTAGARQEDIFVELASSVEKLKSAHDRDPDPADAPSEIAVDEPANEWPAAEK